MRPRRAYYIDHTMGQRSCTTILLCLAVMASAQGAPLPVEDTLLRQLQAAGELQGSLSGDISPVLMPAIVERQELLDSVRRLRFTTGVELLRLYEGTEDFSTPEAHRRIYNVLRAVSSMKGIEYYSASRKKMRTLFAESYAIADPQTPSPQPDPVVDRIPSDTIVYMFQEDLTFGKNLYRSRLRYTGEYFLVETTNLTTMRYLLMPMVQPEASYTLTVLVPVGNRILFYGASGARTLRLLGLERSKEESFYNRLQALYGWFAGRLQAGS